MSDTPKRRLLRKSALQASPFGAPIKSLHSNATTSGDTLSRHHVDSASTSSMVNPFLSPRPISTDIQTLVEEASPLENSPSRKSARLSAIYSSSSSTSTSSSRGTSTPKRPVLPTTPRKKTILKTGVWGHIVGLKKHDESVYYRYPIDKSYCSFGRSDSNDIRVQIDAVSEMHCKLIRRDDGEVWLKDTSTNGTLLNNVLVHDTARPIQHNDIMTIAGRKFRFESSVPIPRAPLQSTSGNTPARQIIYIQETIDDDLQILAEIPSPHVGRGLSTPTKNTARSAAALESALGLFTPNRAAKLSSLLVSPKPVPLPAFLAKSPRHTTMARNVLTMIDEPSILNPTSSSVTMPSSKTYDESGQYTPTKEKRKAPIDFEDDGTGRTPKKVSFGPALSPEVFDKAEPPSTPVKRGQQQGPETPRRRGISTPSLLSKLGSIRPSAKPILTPSRLGRTSIFHDLQKPAPLNLLACTDESAEDDLPEVQSPMAKLYRQTMPEQLEIFAAQERRTIKGQDVPIVADHDGAMQEIMENRATAEDATASSDNNGGSSGANYWEEVDDLGPSPFLDDILDDDTTPPSTPTRTSKERATTLATPPPRNTNNIDISLVHTPVHRQVSRDLQERESSSYRPAPASASRLALLQLSAQKVKGLSDMLHLPESPAQDRENTGWTSNTPTRPSTILSLLGQSGDNGFERRIVKEAEESNLAHKDTQVDAEDDDVSAVDQSEQPNPRNTVLTVSRVDPKRRASAPATTMRGRNESPIFSGLRGVFWTPQKVVESCFAGFTGFRNFVMTPTKPPIQQPYWQQSMEDKSAEESPENDEEDEEEGLVIPGSDESSETSEESAVETLEVQEGLETEESANHVNLDGEAPVVQKTPTKPRTTLSPASTPKRRIASHQDVMAILMGHPREPSPKAKEFSFAKESSLEESKARGRRSDIFPQKRTIAIRNHSQSREDGDAMDDERQEGELTKDLNGTTRRRRTSSLIEFNQETSRSTLVADVTTSRSGKTSVVEPMDEIEGLSHRNAVHVDDEEDAEQAELLRLLGEGASLADDNEDQELGEEEEVEEEVEQSRMEDLDDAGMEMEGNMESLLNNEAPSPQPKMFPRRTSSTFSRSREGTPTIKRRQSFKQRLGSASPAFRNYEQEADEDEDEEDEDDMVLMISPKRVRVQTFLGDC
ncbi:hypothetical protein EDD21DRAFT_373782 [Dissophora ornata]|nr:antigen identified by monoclonal antibody Ki-67 [Dissophora ornata]KAI8601705.1 hypothetical protein EDD21DRAFT_373782 [Dissophora ornata]